MLVSIFNVGGLSEDEMALATPDITEARSLPRHVERCAMRFRLLAKGQAALGRTQVVIIVMGAYLVAVSDPARALFSVLRSAL